MRADGMGCQLDVAVKECSTHFNANLIKSELATALIITIGIVFNQFKRQASWA